MVERSLVLDIFKAKVQPEEISDVINLWKDGKVRFVGFPPVKPYLSVAQVERILSLVRGKRVPTNAFASYAKRAGVSETNFRRFVAQYVGMGFAKVRGFIVEFGENVPALPVFVNNVNPGKRLGVRRGVTFNEDVLRAYLLLNNNVQLYTSEGDIVARGEVLMVLFASWYSSAIRREEKKKGSPVEVEVTVLTHTWVDSGEHYWELVHGGARGFLSALSDYSEGDYHLWGWEYYGYGVLEFSRLDELPVDDRPMYTGIGVISIVGRPGVAVQLLLELRPTLVTSTDVQVIRVSRIENVYTQ